MQDASYYRDQAERARRLARAITDRETEALLSRVARDYEDLAEDLETGAIEIRHPELMPQTRGRHRSGPPIAPANAAQSA